MPLNNAQIAEIQKTAAFNQRRRQREYEESQRLKKELKEIAEPTPAKNESEATNKKGK